MVLCLFVGPVSGQVPSPSQLSGAEAQRQHEFADLSRKIYAAPEATGAERRAINAIPAAQVEEVTNQLHNLVVTDIQTKLAGANASARNVTDAIGTLLGESSISQWDSQTSNTPFAEFVDLDGAQTFVAAYGILRGGGAIPNNRSYIEFYSPDNGSWDLKASAPPDFDGRTFFVSPLPAGLAGQAWILAWGKLIGQTGNSIRMRLYAFDGMEVHTIWQRDDLNEASVTVSGRSVTLEYDKEYHSTERVRETLEVTPNGLQ